MSITPLINLVLRCGVTAMAWGSPGIGKTVTLAGLAEALKVKLFDLNIQTMDPVDFLGMPRADGDRTIYVPPYWLRQVIDDRSGIIFLDEVNQAPPSLMGAAQRILHERRLGEHVIPKEVIIVAAGNKPEHSPSSFELPSQVANRLWHLDWPFVANEWFEGMLSGWPTREFPQLPNDWEKIWYPKVVPTVVAFHRAVPSYLNQMPAERAAQGFAWPSPRTWSMATRLLAAARAMEFNKDQQHLIVAGAVGAAAATAFIAFAEKLDVPDPEAILGDPRGAQVDTDKHRIHVLLAAITQAVIQNPTTERWISAIIYFSRVVQETDAKDIGVLYYLMLNRKFSPTMSHTEIPDEIRKFGRLLAESGVLTGGQS